MPGPYGGWPSPPTWGPPAAGAWPPPTPQSPHGEVGGLPIADIGPRLGAAALDALVGLGVVGFGGAALSNAARNVSVDTPDLAGALALAAVQLLLLVPFVGAAILWRGDGTPGMRALRLRVVDAATGEPPDWGQCVRRAAGTIYSAALLLGGFLWIAVDRRRRSWHDLLADTVVVRRPAETWAPGPGWGAPGWGSSPPTWGASSHQWAPAAADAPPPTGAVAAPSTETVHAESSTDARERAPWTWTDVLPVVVLYYPLGIGLGFVVSHLVHALHRDRLSGAAIPVANTVFEVLVDAVDIGLLYLLVRVRRSTRMAAVGWRRPDLRWLLCGVPLGLVALRVQGALGVVSEALFPGTPQNQCREIRSSFGALLPLAVVAVSVVAPVFEETIFRGFVFGWLRGRLSVGLAIAASAVIFSAAHFAYLQPTIFLPILGTGVILAAVYQLSRSIWTGVVIHGTVNTVALIALLTTSNHC